MNLPCPCNMHSTIESLLRRMICSERETPCADTREILFEIFPFLEHAGCDFYELLSLYAQLGDFSEDELGILLNCAPSPQSICKVEPRYIRQCIPRWTASKYHTGTISEVISEIQHTIQFQKPGLYTYNSNLNPHSHRSLNDLYVLIITGETIRWFDINRKNTYAFSSMDV